MGKLSVPPVVGSLTTSLLALEPGFLIGQDFGKFEKSPDHLAD